MCPLSFYPFAHLTRFVNWKAEQSPAVVIVRAAHCEGAIMFGQFTSALKLDYIYEGREQTKKTLPSSVK